MRKFQITGIACSLAMLSISSAPVFAQTTEAEAAFEKSAQEELIAAQPRSNFFPSTSGPVVPGIHVPEEIAPVTTSVITVDDQHTVDIVQRIPAGEGLFPVIVFIHGGLAYQPLENRIEQSLNGPSHRAATQRVSGLPRLSSDRTPRPLGARR